MKTARRLLLVLIVVPLAVVIAPIAALAIGAESLGGVWLRRRFRRRWGPERIALLVYSDSPHWKAYVEEQWLPVLRGRAVVLNWSERSTWARDRPLEAAVFRHYAGLREFNPVAIVFPEGKRTEVIRFWRAFRDARHGKGHTLRHAEDRLGTLLGVQLPGGGAHAT
jgi:hypothetical protein